MDKQLETIFKASHGVEQLVASFMILDKDAKYRVGYELVDTLFEQAATLKESGFEDDCEQFREAAREVTDEMNMLT